MDKLSARTQLFVPAIFSTQDLGNRRWGDGVPPTEIKEESVSEVLPDPPPLGDSGTIAIGDISPRLITDEPAIGLGGLPAEFLIALSPDILFCLSVRAGDLSKEELKGSRFRSIIKRLRSGELIIDESDSLPISMSHTDMGSTFVSLASKFSSITIVSSSESTSPFWPWLLLLSELTLWLADMVL